MSGRWIQPDPAGLGAADAANPQTWNRYAYVANMPLIAVDLLGLIHCDKSRQECPLDLRGNDLVAIDGMVSERECLIGGGLSSCDLLDPLLTRGFAAACTGQCDRAAFDADGLHIFDSPFSMSRYHPGMPSGTVLAWCWGTGSNPFQHCSHTTIVYNTYGRILLAANNAANNNTPNGAQQSQGKHWPYKDPSSCSVYGSGGPLNFVCRNAGTTRYANSARGCLQTYWDASTGSYSMTPGGPGVPNKPFLPLPSFISFTDSHAVCLVGAFFY